MNRKVLQKVIDELNKEMPSIPYALGILETVMESLPEESKGVAGVPKPVSFPVESSTETTDEAKALEYMAKAKLESVKQMSGDGK